MQRAPRLGILQSLVIGMPTTSAFARLFQFGMRLGLRSWTIGSAWWQADCGPYWGHNAILRVAPFKAHCAIPPLAGKGILSGHILSHDQIEAALMRRAGYDVRVLPEEDLGWEENPPTLIEFLRRDQRWLQGTLQYVFFIGLPGLKPVSRIQLLFAMLMFTGSPAWIGLWLLGTAMLATPRARRLHRRRLWRAAAGAGADDVVRAQDRDRDRRAVPAGTCAAASAGRCGSPPASSPRRSSG